MNPTTQFLYTLDNLYLSTPSIVSGILAIGIGVAIILVLRFALQYISGAFLVHRDQKAINEKKQVLGNLILMKEIQTELEKEIEQAALKATFQS